MKKLIMFAVVAGLVLALAPAAQAAPLVYDLTVTTPADFGGTITLDLDFAPDESTGGVDTYEWGNDALVDFSLFRPGTAVLFTPASIDPPEFTLEMATADDSPLLLWMDMDSTAGGGYIYGELDFVTGEGHIESGNHYVTGAALTPVPEPATMILIALGVPLLLKRSRR